MNPTKSIFWFRQDLRLSDNPALVKAAQAGAVIPVYIVDDSVRRPQAASDWWLYHSLKSLRKSLQGHLYFYRGKPETILEKLIKQTGAQALYWSRLYTPFETRRDKQIKSHFKARNIRVISENASLLWEPWECLKNDGTPYRIFTPFYKRCLSSPHKPRAPLDVPEIDFFKAPDSLALEQLSLLPKIRWDKKLEKFWHIGETAALSKCDSFLKDKLSAYKEARDFPGIEATSRLSPHLHFGEISPHQIWHAASQYVASQGKDHFLSELGWREFSHMLLYHFPGTVKKNLNPKFDNFAWRTDKAHLQAWQRGQTGIPIIDAGMRELWDTGLMHNRVRMITASFLVKNLLIHWHEGEKWFYDCLIDADLANNVAGWQWVAGAGADAAPYFRIFNPVTQARKFDPEGTYIKRFVPELKNLSAKYLHAPWEAPEDVLRGADIKLGNTYPRPIIDLKISRLRALDTYKMLNNNQNSL